MEEQDPAASGSVKSGGRPVSLASFLGQKPVVLVFYRGYW
jgi:peroxiredoxin